MKNLKKKIIFIPIVIALCSLIAYVLMNNSFINSKDISYNTFLEDVNSNKVQDIYFTNSSTLKVKLKDGSIYSTDNPRSLNFKEDMLTHGIKVYESSLSTPKQAIPIAILVISIVSIIVISINQTSKVSAGSAKSLSLDTEDVQGIDFNFEKVAGNDEAKESLKDIVDFLKNPEKYSAYGARMPKGIILYGSPGTGKTLLAKAVAGEAGVPFYAVSGSDFVQVYVGVGAGRIRNLFKKARANGKAVIFIDEIDAIGKKRSNSKSGGSEEKDQTLNALLTEMSGFKETEGIVVIAATNRLDILDPALLRPGRFDRHIEVSLPDLSARKKIIELYLKDKPSNNIDIDLIAKKTAYFSGAKLESFINEAAILACKENSEGIDDLHLDRAFSVVLAGYEKVNREHLNIQDKRITAYHECGHALILSKLLPEEKISKITIIPSSNGAGGYTLSIPEDRQHEYPKHLKYRIMVLLGGRAAEEIIFGQDNITTGAHNDIKKTTDIVTAMITEYGMGSSLGLLNLEELSRKGLSYDSEVLKECKTLVDELYKDTLKILLDNKVILDNLAMKLLEKETLLDIDIENFFKNLL